MRLGQVIGRVTLSSADAALRGSRLLVVQPLSREQFAGAPLQPLGRGSSVVVYDDLGAGVGQIIGFTEGAEAAAPFTQPMPIDAYCAVLVDRIHYTPPRV